MDTLKKMPDFLYPLGEGKNRKECLLVEFDDVLQSSLEAVVYGLLAMEEDRVNFPTIDAIDVIDPIELYYSLAMLDPMSFLLTTRKDVTIGDDYIKTVIDKAHQINTWSNRSRLMMMYAIVNLASAHYVEKVSICNERGLQWFEMEHLTNLFGKDGKKVTFYGGSVSAILEENPEYTTVFMRSTHELINLARNPEQFHLQGKMLFLRNSAENVEFIQEPTGKLVPHELFKEEIHSLSEGKPWKIARFYSTLFDPPANYSGRMW